MPGLLIILYIFPAVSVSFLSSIFWNPDPEIFRIGAFAVRWYGAFFAMAFLTGYVIMKQFLIKENLPLNLRDNLLTYMFLGTIFGARLGHCLFYEPEYYLSRPIEILKIWEGGLASHGGAIGILVALYFFSRHYKMSYLWALDRMVIFVSLGGVFIRAGNLMNSEIIGKASSLPWAFIFGRLADDTPRHPTQIYEAISYLLIFFLLLWYYYKNEGKPSEGIIFGIFLVLLFSARFIIEFFKEVQVEFESNLPLVMGQLLSIPFIIAGIIILIRQNRKSSKNKN